MELAQTLPATASTTTADLERRSRRLSDFGTAALAAALVGGVPAGMSILSLLVG
jgi:hypothetical protein